MVTKSVLVVRQVYRPGFAPWTGSTRVSPRKSTPTRLSSRLSNDQTDMGEESSKVIAIVDDDEDLCSLFSTLVKSLGYHANCVAHDGDEIVQAVLEEGIEADLILMDYRMPTMNGVQAAEKILHVRPEIKIIIATADDSVRRDAIAAGLFFIQKPFSGSTLARTIEEALGH
ncbi:MAG TPA: response regulator [Candidatus Bathyarchaeia archaeon]|nr:response regulator [Candidatus Bathyarchaeia archaeon]